MLCLSFSLRQRQITSFSLIRSPCEGRGLAKRFPGLSKARQIFFSVLGQDRGYTIKYSPPSSVNLNVLFLHICLLITHHTSHKPLTMTNHPPQAPAAVYQGARIQSSLCSHWSPHFTRETFPALLYYIELRRLYD